MTEVAMVQVIEAVALRQQGRWMVSVPALGVSGATRWLSKADGVARDLAAAHLGADVDDLDVTVTARPSDEVVAAWAEADELIGQGQELLARGARLRAEALRQWIATEEVTVRDAAAALGLSPGRVQQIISG